MTNDRYPFKPLHTIQMSSPKEPLVIPAPPGSNLPDISAYLSGPKMTVSKLLKHPNTAGLFKSRHPQIVA
jgi:hypothetical protein